MAFPLSWVIPITPNTEHVGEDKGTDGTIRIFNCSRPMTQMDLHRWFLSILSIILHIRYLCLRCRLWWYRLRGCSTCWRLLDIAMTFARSRDIGIDGFWCINRWLGVHNLLNGPDWAMQDKTQIFFVNQAWADDGYKMSQHFQKCQHFGISWSYLESPSEIHSKECKHAWYWFINSWNRPEVFKLWVGTQTWVALVLFSVAGLSVNTTNTKLNRFTIVNKQQQNHFALCES